MNKINWSRYHIESTFHISIPLLINMNVFLYFSIHTVPDELATSVYWKLDDAGSPSLHPSSVGPFNVPVSRPLKAYIMCTLSPALLVLLSLYQLYSH